MGQKNPRKLPGRSNALTDEILDVDELESGPQGDAMTNRALYLLASWLVSASRKGAPVADTTPAEGSNHHLDVARGAKVGSDGR